MVSIKKVGMSQPLVSCIIVTFNSEKYIEKCLKALLKVTYKSYEIIVVDNGSTDNTADIVQKYLSKKVSFFVLRKNVGYAGGHNFGVKKATGKYVFLLNPDTTVTQNFLQPLVDEMERDLLVAVAQPLVYLEKKRKTINLSGKLPHYLGFDWLRDYNSSVVRESGELLSFSGSGVMVRKAAFQKVGGFDESYFMYYEDSDLGWRLRMCGYSLRFVAESVIFHDYHFVPDQKNQAFEQKLFWAERNRVVTMLKNYELSSLLLFAPMMVVMELALLVYFTLKGWLKIKWKSYQSIWNDRRAIFVKRKKIQSIRSLGDRAIIQDFEKKIEYELFSHPAIKYLLNPVMQLYWFCVWPLI